MYFEAKNNNDYDNWSSFYDYLFEEFLASYHFSDEVSCRKHLSSLKPYGTMLWDSYRKKEVLVDYDHKLTQDAYILRYGPLYIDGIYKILQSIDSIERINFEGKPELSFFSAGPAIEVIGFFKWYVKEKIPLRRGKWDFTKLPKPESFSLNLFDKQKWEHSRKIVKKSLNTYLIHQELSSPKIIDNRINIFNYQRIKVGVSSKIILFQNCLNELLSQEKEEVLLDCLGNIIKQSLSKEGLLIFSERRGYGANIFLEEFEKKNSSWLNKILENQLDQRSLELVDIPQIIKQEFLTGEGKLIPSQTNRIEYQAYKRK